MSGIPRKHAHSVQATAFARVRLRNFCLRKRPSFLASRRFAQEDPTRVLKMVLTLFNKERFGYSAYKKIILKSSRSRAIRFKSAAIFE